MANTPPTAVLARIDNVMLDLVRQLADNLQPPLSPTLDITQSSSDGGGEQHSNEVDRPAKRCRDAKAKTAKPVPLKLGAVNGVSFPTKSVVGIRRFAQYLRVLELVQANLLHGMVVTKRDVYYQSTHLFPSQQASDRMIERVVSLLGCADRGEIGIVASPRGFVSGPLTLVSTSNTVLSCKPGVPTLIPTELTVNAGWSLTLACESAHGFDCMGHLAIVVEKEAVFKALLQLAHPRSTSTRIHWSNAVLITGKGYPDHATRALVQLLSGATCAAGAAVRVVGLFDSDAYGVDIYRQYCSVCTVEWAGVDLEDFLPSPAVYEEHGNPTYPLIPLRNDERAKAVRMLRTLHHRDEVTGSRERLTGMLLAGYKVEIEAAYDFAASPKGSIGSTQRGGLTEYLEHKLFSSAHPHPSSHTTTCTRSNEP